MKGLVKEFGKGLLQGIIGATMVATGVGVILAGFKILTKEVI